MGEHRPLVAVTFPVEREVLAGLFGDAARAEPVADLPERERSRTLHAADVLFVWNWQRELRPGERESLGARFVQLLSAGADHLPFDQLPPNAVVASNAGAYAEPMAEHAVAMTLALLKRLPQHHAELAAGVWNQSAVNLPARGAVCGILGFGGIGKATGRLLRALGARIHAINTSGRTDESVEFVGTLDDLDAVLGAADALVIALPLTRRTRGLLGARELGLLSRPRSWSTSPAARSSTRPPSTSTCGRIRRPRQASTRGGRNRSPAASSGSSTRSSTCRTCSARRTTRRWCLGSWSRRPPGPPRTSCASYEGTR